MGSWGQQYSVGNQGSSRETFWASGFKKCPQCNESDVAESSTCAGCRMNGDGYGTTEFRCRKCGWLTSFQYDDAAETYYYETSGWKREDDVSGWGAHKVKQALIDHGIPERVVQVFFKEEVDGEVLLRSPPCLTREFMMGHPKWKLDEHDVNLFRPVYRKLTGRELQ